MRSSSIHPRGFMDSEPIIRPGTCADRAEVEAIVSAAYAPYVPRIGMRPKPMDADYAAALADGVLTVLEVAGQVAGFVILRHAPAHMLLENIAVAPAFQGQGLGGRLIAIAHSAARAAGVPKLILYTHVKMTENVALYQRQGFEIVEEREEFGLHRVYMEKRL